jgi:hypothetical protein
MVKTRITLPDKRIEELFSATDHMTAAPGPPAMSPEDVVREISAMRAKRISRQ